MDDMWWGKDAENRGRQNITVMEIVNKKICEVGIQRKKVQQFVINEGDWLIEINDRDAPIRHWRIIGRPIINA